MKAFPSEEERRGQEGKSTEHGKPGWVLRDSPLVVVRGEGAPSGGEAEAQEDDDGV